jgi:hypothetical protein
LSTPVDNLNVHDIADEVVADECCTRAAVTEVAGRPRSRSRI